MHHSVCQCESCIWVRFHCFCSSTPLLIHARAHAPNTDDKKMFSFVSHLASEGAEWQVADVQVPGLSAATKGAFAAELRKRKEAHLRRERKKGNVFATYCFELICRAHCVCMLCVASQQRKTGNMKSVCGRKKRRSPRPLRCRRCW